VDVSHGLVRGRRVTTGCSLLQEVREGIEQGGEEGERDDDDEHGDPSAPPPRRVAMG
jgi:hypothetical protein